MRGKILLSLVLVCCFVARGTLPGSGAGPVTPAAPRDNEQVRPEKRGEKAVAKMIDALANRNRPPKLVKFEGGRYPLFPAEYDWKEEARVRSALAKVRSERTTEMWEELVRRIGDKRYCLSRKDKEEFFALGNWSVGTFCSMFADEWLVGVCERHLPTSPIKPYPIHLGLGLRGRLAKWRKQRADKQLYELQIEVGEEMIRELAKTDEVSKHAKERARKKIEAEIANLKRKKRPIFTNFSVQQIDFYSVKEAKKARELLESGKNGAKKGSKG
jgi:hypothetical protein